MLDPRQALAGPRQVVGVEEAAGTDELVHHQLQPQLGGLVLDDEEQLVGVLRIAQRVLGGEQRVEVEVTGVVALVREVRAHTGFQGPVSLLDRHRVTVTRR